MGGMAGDPALPEWAKEDVQTYLGRLARQRRLSGHTVNAYRGDNHPVPGPVRQGGTRRPGGDRP